MSIKKGMKIAWHKFLQTNFNVFMRSGQGIEKQRRYQHIEIQEKFEDMEKDRKKQRLVLIEYKKKMKKRLIEQQIDYLSKQKEIGILNPILPENQDDSQQALLEESKKYDERRKTEQHTSFDSYAKAMWQKQSQPIHPTVTITELKDEEDVRNDLLDQLSKINNELEQIKQTKDELEKIEGEIEDLEPDYIMVSGMQKQLVLNQIAYYEFQSRNLQGFNLHPETMKAIEKVHYNVDHNIPIKRELLFEVCPELFEGEMDTLDQIEREKILAKRPRLDSNDSSVIRVTEKYPKAGSLPKPLHPLEQIKVDEYEMRDLVYRRCGQFSQKWGHHFIEKQEMGFAGVSIILENIELKPEDKLTEEEKELKNDLIELQRINQDFARFCEILKDRAIAEQKKLQIPEFVKQNKRLEAAWIEKWETLVANSFDFSESVLLPDNSNTVESEFDHILSEYRKADIKQLIEQSNEEYKSIVGGDEPIRVRDPKEKNVNLIQKLNILSDVMNTLPDREERKQIPQFQGQVTSTDHPEEKRILISEMPKILFLNNKNPRQYTVDFWAKHFNIEPQKLRNIFNYVSFAIPDITNEKETGKVFRFIYEN